MPIRKTIRLGKVCLIEEHPAPAFGKNKRRPTSKAETTPKQNELNDRHAAKKMAWLILCNFSAHTDLFVTLTHPARTSEQDARKAVRDFLSKLRAYHRKMGTQLKYILVTEKQSQWHHHLITQNLPLDVIRELWGRQKRVTVSSLDPFDDYKSLAEYLVMEKKSSRKKEAADGEKENAKKPRRKGERRYSCSKNLEKPDITVREIKRITKTQPRPPKGYALTSWQKWQDDYGDLHAVYRCVWTGSGPPPKLRQQKT